VDVDTSVVVPNLNGAHLLEPCLEALARQTRAPTEVIVVDNGSTDDSVGLVRRRFPAVRLLTFPENRGFAAAMNAGIAEATAGLVAFLNNDAVPESAWLEELAGCVERHPAAAAATSKLLLADEPGRLDGAGDGLTRSFLPYARGHGQPDDGRFADEIEVFGASGAAALWRGPVLRELGGFDERFFAYYEDVDLSFRARLRGYEIWYAPSAVVRHARGGTAGQDVDFTLFHPVKNRWFMIVKDTPGRMVARRWPAIAAGEALFWGRMVRRRAPGALLRAYREVMRRWPELRRDRKEIQSTRRVSAQRLDAFLGRPPR
jgi:GT2 family glycosyltransferase